MPCPSLLPFATSYQLSEATVTHASRKLTDFLVLDELHTYRGRQGADVAMLVRRVRNRLCRNKVPICIGTSATMANEGEDQTRAAAVAKVATRLFGVKVTPDAIIDESLERDLRMLPSRGPSPALPIS